MATWHVLGIEGEKAGIEICVVSIIWCMRKVRIRNNCIFRGGIFEAGMGKCFFLDQDSFNISRKRSVKDILVIKLFFFYQKVTKKFFFLSCKGGECL